jgi:hypothetical protein
MRTVGLRPTSGTLLAAALALAIAGCALFEPEPDGTFSVVIAARDHVDPLAVDVIDRTGTVTAVIVAEGPFREGVVAGPDDPDDAHAGADSRRDADQRGHGSEGRRVPHGRDQAVDRDPLRAATGPGVRRARAHLTQRGASTSSRSSALASTGSVNVSVIRRSAPPSVSEQGARARRQLRPVSSMASVCG